MIESFETPTTTCRTATLQGPAYIVEEDKLRQNLSLIRHICEESGAEFIVAFKAFAGWKLFPFFNEYGFYTAAVSSPYEARLAAEELGNKGHAFSPAYLPYEYAFWKEHCSHITFNSLSQAAAYFSAYPEEQNRDNSTRSCAYALRINPHFSPVETDLYNPALPGSRFGVPKEELRQGLPQGIDGLHVHVLCESNSFHLEKLLDVLHKDFHHALMDARYINLGGGHLVTHKSYNVPHLIEVLKGFHQRYPHLKIYLEPGSAYTWQTGYLQSHVVDIVEREGIATAILDVSFTCHMPDCLEMPYTPTIRGAVHEEQRKENPQAGNYAYRMGGNSCLSGDFMGTWYFEAPLHVGDTVIFEDMIHYTMVKTTMFNGIHHPSLALLKSNGTLEILRQYEYADYKNRMS